MHRRVVSLLLLPCILLTQLAALGHSHGGSGLAGHDHRPHIHLKPAATRHDHSHHHHGDGHHHHHADAVDKLADSDAPPTQQPQPFSDDEHGSDAIFLDRVDAVVNNSPAEGIRASLRWTAVWSCLPAELRASPARVVVLQTHGPPSRGDHCPIYIWQLTLLI